MSTAKTTIQLAAPYQRDRWLTPKPRLDDLIKPLTGRHDGDFDLLPVHADAATGGCVFRRTPIQSPFRLLEAHCPRSDRTIKEMRYALGRIFSYSGFPIQLQTAFQEVMGGIQTNQANAVCEALVSASGSPPALESVQSSEGKPTLSPFLAFLVALRQQLELALEGPAAPVLFDKIVEGDVASLPVEALVNQILHDLGLKAIQLVFRSTL